MEAAILIVEDEILIAFHLQALLEQGGHRVIDIATDPAEALQLARSERPDFVLMDVRLAGGGSGIDAARLLHEQLGVRCVFVSASIDTNLRSRTATLQPLGYLGKPFMASEVLHMVGQALHLLRLDGQVEL